MLRQALSLHHETIYLLIYADMAEGGGTYTHLRVVVMPYRERYGFHDWRGKIKCQYISTNARLLLSTVVASGAGKGRRRGQGVESALLTMVERKTIYTVIIRLTGKRGDLLAEAALVGMAAWNRG